MKRIDPAPSRAARRPRRGQVRFRFEGAPKRLFPAQRRFLTEGWAEKPRPLLIDLPPGAGKSALALEVAARALETQRRVLWLSPLRALAVEQQALLERAFPQADPLLLLGGAIPKRSPRDAAVIIATPERAAFFFSRWRRHYDWLTRLGVIIIDEAHLLDDPRRGPTLELLVSRARRLLPRARLLLLSATFGDCDRLCRWLDADRFHDARAPQAPAARVCVFRGVADFHRRFDEECQTLAARGPLLVFASSRARAERLAARCRDRGLSAASHHAGCSDADRAQREAAFRAGKCRVLCCTPTLEQGVNLPAASVLVADSARVEGRRRTPISPRSWRQMAGRAGRGRRSRAAGIVEAVLLRAKSRPGDEHALNAPCDPIRSRLFDDSDAFARCLLDEIDTGFARTQGALERHVLPSTLLAQDHGAITVHHHVERLARLGLIERIDRPPRATLLVVTAMGRVLARHRAALETWALLERCERLAQEGSAFDLAFLSALSADTETAVIPTEGRLCALATALVRMPSLALEVPWLSSAWRTPEAPIPTPVQARRVLAAMFLAASWHEDAPSGALSGILPGDDARLRAQAVSTARLAADRACCLARISHQCARRWGALAQLIEKRAPLSDIELAGVKNLGPVRRATLRQAGFRDVEMLALADPAHLASLRGISRRLANILIVGAQQALAAPLFDRRPDAARPQAPPLTHAPGADDAIWHEWPLAQAIWPLYRLAAAR